MPENDAPISKTQGIRQYLAEHPDASPKAVGEALVAQGIEVSSAFVSTVRAKLESARRSDDSVNDVLITLGKAQVDAMFRPQDDYPVDDSEFLPLVEAALTLRNPDHEEWDETSDWRGPWRPEQFDAAATTKAMRRGLPNWRDME